MSDLIVTVLDVVHAVRVLAEQGDHFTKFDRMTPTAGNPSKWIPVNDNGTTRYIPAW